MKSLLRCAAHPDEICPPLTRSLRVRLLAGLLVTILAAWGALFLEYRSDVMRERTGEWDTNLRGVAEVALLSLPQGFENTALPQSFSLPRPADFNGKAMRVSFQAWSLRDGHALLRAPSAPEQPLVPSMADGFATVTIDGESWRTYALSDAKGLIQLQVGSPRSRMESDLHERIDRGLEVLGLLFLLLAGVTWLVINASLLPVMRVSDAIRQRRAVDLQPLPAGDLPAELRPLVDSFNRLLARLDAAVQSERRFLVDAAHELRTPLAVLTVQTENALRSDDPAQLRDSLHKMLATTQRSARLSEQLLDMARLDAGGVDEPAADVDLRTVLRVIVGDFEVIAAQRGQSLSLDAEACMVRGHMDSLGILVRNLIDNAVRHSGRGSRIAVSCRQLRTRAGMEALLCVTDDGPGVEEAQRERIFDRFYRIPGTAEHGSGIGLSLVAQIAELHGAGLEVGTGPGGAGLAVSVRFRVSARGDAR